MFPEGNPAVSDGKSTIRQIGTISNKNSLDCLTVKYAKHAKGIWLLFAWFAWFAADGFRGKPLKRLKTGGRLDHPAEAGC